MNCQAVVRVFITVRDQGRCNYGRKYCDYCHACHPASVPCHETNVTDISDDLNIHHRDDVKYFVRASELYTSHSVFIRRPN